MYLVEARPGAGVWVRRVSGRAASAPSAFSAPSETRASLLFSPANKPTSESGFHFPQSPDSSQTYGGCGGDFDDMGVDS